MLKSNLKELKSFGLYSGLIMLLIIPLKIAQAQEIESKEPNLPVIESKSSLLLYGGEKTRDKST